MSEPLVERAELAAALDQRLAELHGLDEADDGYAAACDSALAAGEALVEFERRLPERLEAGPHRITRLVLAGGGGLAVLAGLGLGAGVFAGPLQSWWLPCAAAALVAGVVVLRTPVRPAIGTHRRQRPGAIEVALAALVLLAAAIGGFGAVATWWLLAAAAGLAGLGLATLRSVPVAPTSLRRPSEDP